MIKYVNNTNCASLFAIELEKLLVNDKITALCQTNVSHKDPQRFESY